MQYKTLCLDLTTDCNMSCPWCIAAPLKDKLNLKGYLSEKSEKILKEHIKNIPHLMYSFHGGECTLYPEKMLELMDFIKEKNPAGVIRLFTNGSRLTEKLVQELNNRDVDVVIGVGLTGYKTVENMLKHSSEPDKLIQNIKQLKHRTIRIVPDYHDEFAYECYLLHTIFDCFIEVTHNYETLEKWVDSNGFTAEELSLFAEAKKANVDFAKALKPYLPETSDQRISKLEQKIDMLIDSLGGQKNP